MLTILFCLVLLFFLAVFLARWLRQRRRRPYAVGFSMRAPPEVPAGREPEKLVDLEPDFDNSFDADEELEETDEELDYDA